MYRKSKLFITALLGIALLAGVAGAEELWEPGDFFAPPVPVSGEIPILGFAFFVPGQVPAATAGQVPAVTPSSWSGTPEGFVAPVFTGAFASPFIGPNPLSNPEAYEPIATGGSQASTSAADATDSWSDWFSRPTPSSCPL